MNFAYRSGYEKPEKKQKDKEITFIFGHQSEAIYRLFSIFSMRILMVKVKMSHHEVTVKCRNRFQSHNMNLIIGNRVLGVMSCFPVFHIRHQMQK